MSKKILGWAFVWALWSGWVQAQPVLTIRILEKRDLSLVQLKEEGQPGGWTEIKLSRGILTVNGKPQESLRFGGPTWVHLRAKGLDRRYPGVLNISKALDGHGDFLLIIDEVPLDQYVACVTAAESGFDESQPEYLKALAVVIQEYARGHRNRHPGYDLCDLAHCQVYQGIPPHSDFWERIARVAGSFEAHSPANSYYFNRCCGGVLESAAEAWGAPGKDPGATRTGPDELEGMTLCGSDAYFTWNTSTEVEKVGTLFREIAALPPGSRLTGLRVAEKTSHGRNRTLVGVFNLPNGRSREVRENAGKFISEFGKRFGWRVFPSAWFDIERDGKLFRFSGHGFGHGVGLCQSGALRLAQMGWTWKKILKFYFPHD